MEVFEDSLEFREIECLLIAVVTFSSHTIDIVIEESGSNWSKKYVGLWPIYLPREEQ